MEVVKWNGKPISKPGWYSGVPLETYHSAGMCDGPAVSSSDLRTCWSKSPAHMYAKWAENPDAEKPETTRAMVLGSCAHHLLLGEDDFQLKFVRQPPMYRDKVTATDKPWNNNAIVCKKWNTEQRDAGRIIVTDKELNAIIKMAESLRLTPLVQQGLLRGHVETSGFFKHKRTGLWIKVRPDVIPMGADFVDLKTASDVTTPALMSSVRTLGYHQQGALIWQACEALGQPFESFALMFVETVAPWCARSIQLPDEDIGLGRDQNEFTLSQIKASIDIGHWPGPGDDMQSLGLSKDERERIRTRIKVEGLTT